MNKRYFSKQPTSTTTNGADYKEQDQDRQRPRVDLNKKEQAHLFWPHEAWEQIDDDCSLPAETRRPSKRNGNQYQRPSQG